MGGDETIQVSLLVPKPPLRRVSADSFRNGLHGPIHQMNAYTVTDALGRFMRTHSWTSLDAGAIRRIDSALLVEWVKAQAQDWKASIGGGTYPHSIICVPLKTAKTYAKGWAKRARLITARNAHRLILSWRLDTLRWQTKYFAPKLP